MLTDLNASRDWRHQGACRDLDPELWSNGDAQAKAICVNQCPVRAACLAWATDNDEPIGIWGGEEAPFGERLRCGHRTNEATTAGRGCRACNRADNQRARQLAQGDGRGPCIDCHRHMITERAYNKLHGEARAQSCRYGAYGRCIRCASRHRRAIRAGASC
ncbi:WhiB-like transcription regulator [Alloactinosynnema sp. L-07]|uniref:WhiB family transcriptional regulator n=1 Tax=Alloactinosynnema sp. L-07 TaxID=1653480 RepID=UPI00065F0B99|nr:WhiB family transcriptional regulator [Alloactinosynnema sp. L-07]CRK59041.1 WhiB-like transcription regulator [Alloactinosynnema sp. L-07]